MPAIHVFDTPEAMSAAAADWVAECIAQTLKKKDRFSFVLSGGNTPKAMYHLLAAQPLMARIDWEKLDFFWGDERFVPFTDERNNAKMAFDSLLSHVPVRPERIHRMDTTLAPADAARAYENKIRNYFRETGSKGFDLVLLGMGGDGHTLSLFPGTGTMFENKAWVIAYELASQQMYRITLTAPLVNHSERVAFVVSGGDKAEALQQVLQGEYHPALFPSQVISPESGELHWFVDKAAAALR